MSDGRREVRYDSVEACRHLTLADPRLGKLIAAVGRFGLKTKSSHSPFEALLESIIYQQLHGKAAAAILTRLLHAFGDLHPAPEHILATPDERLRAAGVSRGKIHALRDLAAKTLDGTVPTLSRIRRMSDDDIIEHLTQVRGIGPVDSGDAADLSVRSARRLAGYRLWREEGLRLDIPANPQKQTVFERPTPPKQTVFERPTPPARGNAAAGREVASLALRGELVLVASLRSRREAVSHLRGSWK